MTIPTTPQEEGINFVTQYMRNNYSVLHQSNPEEYHLRLGLLADVILEYIDSRSSPTPEEVRGRAREAAEEIVNQYNDALWGHQGDLAEIIESHFLHPRPTEKGEQP